MQTSWCFIICLLLLAVLDVGGSSEFVNFVRCNESELGDVFWCVWNYGKWKFFTVCWIYIYKRKYMRVAWARMRATMKMLRQTGRRVWVLSSKTSILALRVWILWIERTILCNNERFSTVHIIQFTYLHRRALTSFLLLADYPPLVSFRPHTYKHINTHTTSRSHSTDINTYVSPLNGRLFLFPFSSFVGIYMHITFEGGKREKESVCESGGKRGGGAATELTISLHNRNSSTSTVIFDVASAIVGCKCFHFSHFLLMWAKFSCAYFSAVQYIICTHTLTNKLPIYIRMHAHIFPRCSKEGGYDMVCLLEKKKHTRKSENEFSFLEVEYTHTTYEGQLKFGGYRRKMYGGKTNETVKHCK